MKSLWFFNCFIFLLIVSNAHAQLSITSMPQSVCGTVSFSVQLGGSFQGNAGNQFRIQLSDSTGSFTNPLVIGQLNATSPGLVNCVIPSSTLSGLNYQLRVIATLPFLIGSNGTNSMVYHAQEVPPINPGGQASLCGNSQLLMFTSNKPYIQWIRNGVPIPGANAPIFQASQTGTYRVRSGPSVGCNFESGTTVVTQGTVPSANQITGPTQICPGNTANLQTVDQILEWRLNGNPIAGAIPVLQASNPGIYRAVVQNQSGCNALSNPHSLAFDTIPFNQISVIQGQLCMNQQAVFFGGTSALYQWYVKTPNGQGPFLSTLPQFAFTPTSIGIYPPASDSLCLQLTGFNGCTSVSCFKDTIGVAPPRPFIIKNGLTLTSSNLVGNAWYDVASGFIPGALNRSFNPVNSGNFYVVTIGPAGCRSPNSDTVNVVFTETVDLNLENGVRLFPSPANSHFRINTDVPFFGASDVSIFNIEGRVVKQWNLQPQQVNQERYDINDLPPGLYGVHIRNANLSYNLKLVIQQ